MREDLIEYGINENKVFATGMPISGRFLEKFDKEKVLVNISTVFFGRENNVQVSMSDIEKL